MAGRKQATMMSAVPERSAAARVSRGRTHPGGASFPVAPPRSGLPRGDQPTLVDTMPEALRRSLPTVEAIEAELALSPRTSRSSGMARTDCAKQERDHAS